MKKNVLFFLAAFIVMATTCKAACLSHQIELQSSILDPTSQHDGQCIGGDGGFDTYIYKAGKRMSKAVMI